MTVPARFTLLLAVVTYLLVVVAGGMAPGYSHLADPVSALYRLGAPGSLWVMAGFMAYNILLVPAGVELLETGAGWRGTGVALLATAAFGLILAFMPMDAEGSGFSTMGAVHLVLAAACSLSTLSTLALAARSLARLGDRQGARIALATLVFVASSGLIAASAAAGGSTLAGLFERLTIGAFLVWLAGLAIRAPVLRSGRA